MKITHDVALIVDNPKRDLRGVVLSAFQLAERGQNALVVPMYVQGYDVPLLAPRQIVLNYIRQSNQNIVETFRRQGIATAVMDTEGGILSAKGLREPNNWARSLKDSGLSRLVDDYYFWGSAVQVAFEKESGLAEEHLHLTGCPRYDICAAPWNGVLTYERDKFILVNTNFSAINPGFTRSSHSEKAIFRSLGWPDEYIETMFTQLNEVHRRYVQEVYQLAAALPEQTIVIRPHPFENENFYRDRFRACANVVVDGRGDVLNMISKAYCVVHLNCGTSVDALLQNKIPISLEYLNTDFLAEHTPLPSKISWRASSREDLIRKISDVTAGRASFDLEAAYMHIEPWFYVNDGRASARLADGLVARTTGSQRGHVLSALKGGRAKPSAGQALLGLASFVFGSKMTSAVRAKVQKDRQGKNIAVEDVQSLLDAFSSLSNGRRYIARHARNPYTSLPLSSIEVVPA